ncbi:hypothetical protein TNCV_258091 [Trichonephila clavipes]|uniref:Uncharacterized protein n=1 Tax=Trichonephila clavipes TaxID=2585209 RepID=A0A8X6RSJ5_TRICX|nr:hypothetical protein TNCV_258091 [Trichonephila clavipes]
MSSGHELVAGTTKPLARVLMPLKTHRVEELINVKSAEFKIFTWWGVDVKRLSEFERGLIIDMKTAVWSTHRVEHLSANLEMPFKYEGSSGHEMIFICGKPVTNRKMTRQEYDRAASSSESHIVPYTIGCRASSYANDFQQLWNQLKRQMPSCTGFGDDCSRFVGTSDSRLYSMSKKLADRMVIYILVEDSLTRY